MKYLSIIFFLFFLFACYGWGYAITRCSTFCKKDNFVFLSVVGIVCLVFLGGILNLARLAYPVALGILLLAGLTFFVIRYSSGARVWLTARQAGSLVTPGRLAQILEHNLPLAILIAAIVFYALMLLPSATFNITDDLQTYIPRPLRMLQTGTLTGDRLETLGIDSLGGQSFLHGFVLLGFPIEYLLGFDAVFCFALAGLLLIVIGSKFNLHWSYKASAIFVFIIINPRTANITAVYIASVIILGLSYASCLLLDQMEESGDGAIPKMMAGILGLLFAGLVALKITFVSYALAYFTIFFLGLLLLRQGKQNVPKICGLVLLSAFIALLPWLALHAATYASAIQAGLYSPTPTTENGFSIPKGNIAALFSASSLRYGDSLLSYGIIVLVLAAVGCYALFITFYSKVAPLQRGYFLVVFSSCTAGVICYFFNGLFIYPGVSVRYSSPVIVATLPFALLAVAMTIPNTSHTTKLLNPSGTRMAIILLLPLLIIIPFWNHFISRIERIYHEHAMLMFPIDDHYIEHVHYLTSSDARQKIHEIQYMTQPDQKILAWISTPIHLDFPRNEIYSITDNSLLNPLLDIPLNSNVGDMIRHLKGQGIRYIMWQYNDIMAGEERFRQMVSGQAPLTRRIGERGLYWRKMLASIMHEGSFLYHEDSMVLIDLQQVK